MHRPTALVRTVVVLISAAYSLLLFTLGVSLPALQRTIVSALPTVAVALVVAWDLWLWRLPGVQRLTRQPDLRGLWRVELTPHPDSNIPPGGNRGPIDAFIEIKQTYWDIHLRLYTNESASKSSAASWLPTFETEVDSLTFTYLNTPRIAESHRSARSAGACELHPASLKPAEIEGTYFTDRQTKGDLRMVLVDRSAGHASFGAATRYMERMEAA